MPDSIAEPLANPLFHIRTSSIDHQSLPYHHNHVPPRTHEEERSASEVELDEFSRTQKYTTKSPHVTFSLAEDEEVELSDSEHSERDHLVPENLVHQMKRNKSKKNKDKRSPSRPNLRIDTDTNGHANGHANGNMDKHMEMRRKHVSSDDPAANATRAISRDDFSLDNEPLAPQTPQTPGMVNTSFSNLPPQDKKNFLLLVLLYFLQGIPMGLASGSVPFLLKSYLSYGQIGIFSLAIYPYSLKLLWSPIVDAVWSRRFGRRKSWITPVQTVSGLSMIYLGGRIDELMHKAGAKDGSGVWGFTGWWFLLVFLCATQDIAVDGWAISLLSLQNISYASTAQTVGLTAGSFLSHTVFLALQAPDFANKWFRAVPKEYGLLTLGGYMAFWGWAYLLVTIGIAIMKREDKTNEREGILDVYRSMWAVLRLPNIITILIIHLIGKLGFVTNDAVTNLKLLDKGFGQANMALVVLIDFPFELGLGYYAGKWSTQYTPLKLWCWAYVARLVAAVFAQITIMIYPTAVDEAVPLWYMLVVIAEHIYSTFMNTVMFVAVAAFHARIADPAIGGTYMTLLATFSNLGGTFPKFFILKFVDVFTKATCLPPADPDAFTKANPGITPITQSFSCALESDKNLCLKGGGTCLMQRDGYYITNTVFVITGAILFWMYIEKKALALQALPLRAWRIQGDQSYHRVATS
ncbi:acetyl-CoA transporter [Exophiala viscosa]|uniref:Acetyl-CoA transporter n=1 Tax=Exophiala viscosa TaxID=2486360 RepID=A0AAN6E352_9EURO|nr:acetyl-CoA transporter [Exophiala viscosa]